jgi:hypothetical protein
VSVRFVRRFSSGNHDTQVRELADFVIEIPETSDALSPIQQYLYNFIVSYSGDEGVT